MRTFGGIFLFVLLPVLAVMLTAGVAFHFFGRESAETSATAQLESSASLAAKLVDDQVQRIGDSLSTLLAQEAISNYFMFRAAGLLDDAEDNRLEVEHSFVRLAESEENIRQIELYSGDGHRLVAVIDGMRTLEPRELDQEGWFRSTLEKHGYAVFAEEGSIRISRVAIDEGESVPYAIATVLYDFEIGASASAAFATQYLSNSRVSIQGARAAAPFIYGEETTDDPLVATAPIATLEGSVTVRQARSAALATFRQSEMILFTALSLVTLGLLVMIAVGTNLVLRNIRKAQQAAELANTAKSAFLANMSHELRTPMNAILGYSEMLIEEAEEQEQPDFIPDLQKIHEAGEHLLALINDVLDLSKIEAGRMDLYLETFDIVSIVQAIASTVKPLVAKNQNELVVECGNDLGNMHADLTKLRQSLLNLLSNAAKFTERGTLTLEVTREGDRVRFDVSDTGIGIPPERIERLFEEFTQADESTSRDFGGTGLGLAISRRFCRMMGGDITAVSEAGAGSTFTIVLPAHVAVEAASAPRGESEEVREGEGSLVLVIDDDPTACELLARTLKRDGFRVVTADNGEDGLRLARELHPMAITLDVIMPGTDGWNVLSELKADPELHEIPVVMVTMLDEQRRGYTLGAAEFMTKPVDRERLSRVLARYSQGDTRATVLIVEDEADTRELLRRVVENEGWEATVAENGREGLERMKASCPSLIFTDLMMPEMNGFDFIDELRSVEAWRTIPVIVLTAKDLTAEDRSRLSKQVERILDKGSNSREDLVARLRDLVGAPQGE